MNPYHYAVVVGINNYPGWGDLDGPVNDANDFQEWLVSDGGLPPNNVVPLTVKKSGQNINEAEPIKHQVDNMLESIHRKMINDTAHDPEALWRQSRLYVFLAGHGIMPRAGESALMLANAHPERPENLETSMYADWYRNHSGIFKEVVFFADCCRNWCETAPAGGPPFKVGSPTGSPPVFSLIGYACAPARPAYEHKEGPPDERRGYFTRALLRGLRGAAAIDPDEGVITLKTLSPYVISAVEHATKDKPFPQAVSWPSSDSGYSLRFSAPSAAPLSKVLVHFPPGFARPVSLLRPDGTRDSWALAPRPWLLDLPDGRYSITETQPGSVDSFAQEGLFSVFGDCDVQL
ncbi:hypothetical protein A5669_05115 [Mycolicibacterium fortuitum]|nr:hypothetical protein A5669_05115 [Mycolicibacterium fortuitum]